ncbi:hypothetical protein PSN45_004607 [Yamadazyma tenuis]|uniref:Uncharacterized protein n=1 Tax=Candida tenuis (strain ATCC 10573 / BCRC 21748 / CBS 615 / JCM 9827 / NBRC 10315 / NRRL Y-1498 / VKM Y-70) TaxID=590646 RepID=G3B530_CANTC|nr:uncharacterized protein CANTEDRAFT_93894 [Yamadazyma tenuis ATCC 10573]EGV63123.1 hypothetical protein CANTEDRAFT_93894 [Yamadazyma tenuis ATCC 10573]WEJ97060.1 hypothetical protein PSN45_004607 [Yamadazyma tenuis]
MALKNYLYAKHARDEFTLSLMQKANIIIPQNLQPLGAGSGNEEKAKSHCSDIESCNNCANCPNKKNTPKITIEIDRDTKLEQEIESINHTLTEIDFTNKI